MNLSLPLPIHLLRSLAARLAWGALVLFLAANLPLFVCTQLNGDAAYYDLQVQCLNEGGVLYRDMLEPNLPGVIWIHMLVRAIGGQSSIALRVFDLLVLGGIIAFLVHGHRRVSPVPRPVQLPVGDFRAPVLSRHALASGSSVGDAKEPWASAQRLICNTREMDRALVAPLLALSVCWCYFALCPTSQCQRDLWMLLPCLGAMHLREWSLLLMRKCPAETTRLIIISILEGILWGSAVWIKPHVFVPALSVIVISILVSKLSRHSLASFCAVVAGGLLIGAIGSMWLISSGTWPHFWEMQLHWNPEYLASRSNWNWIERYTSLFQILSPWSFAHLVALPVAVVTLAQSVRRQTCHGSPTSQDSHWPVLLAALYLGWCVQSAVLQHPFEYTLVPGVILAMSVVAGIQWKYEWRYVPRVAITTVFLIATLVSPCTNPKRLAAWKDCVKFGPTLGVQAKIQGRPELYWAYYDDVIRFLQQRGVRDHDVLVYSTALVGLYSDLDVRPPTRYVLPDVHAVFFPSRLAGMHQSIEHSSHRYVVSDISGLGLDPESFDQIDPQTRLPVTYPESLVRRFPATQPVVFRSGWFVVHEARQPIGPLASMP